jgi:PPM family protein phosphatase
MLDVRIASLSDPGQRAGNEDALRTGLLGPRHYAVLADGAGGHARGAEAAACVVDHIEAALCAAAPPFASQTLGDALLAAHAALQAAQQDAQGRSRMHATVVVLWLDTRLERALWSHVGDSRLYRFRYGAVDLVTADDSVVQRMLQGGVITPQQAQDHPMKHQLLAALGTPDALEPHTVAAAEAIEDGDVFLLCTDGWWGTLGDAEMIETLGVADTPQAWLATMRQRIHARAVPVQDNFSAIAAWVSDPTQRTQAMADENEEAAATATAQAGIAA